MKILWVSRHCLHDTTSGASLSVKTILNSLSKAGAEVRMLQMTVFDSPPGAEQFFKKMRAIYEAESGTVCYINIQEIQNIIIKSQSWNSRDTTYFEVEEWMKSYHYQLDVFQPDIVLFYGAQTIDLVIASAARQRGISAFAYLANPNYKGAEWVRDLTGILTDTHATSNFYKEKYGFIPTPIGKFIANDKLGSGNRKFLTLINPSASKGGFVFLKICQALEVINSQIEVLIVESRANVSEIVDRIQEGDPNFKLPSNITVMKNTDDMSSVYAVTKVLCVPSLWWESGARVIAEAILNDIPVVATDRGGNSEMVGKGGYIFRLPEQFYQKPFNLVPDVDSLIPLARKIEELFKSNDEYARLISNVRAEKVRFDLDLNTKKLFSFLSQYRLGTRNIEDQVLTRQKSHRHNLMCFPKYFPHQYGEFKYQLKEGERGIFIDCGGYDGCSALKFISQNTNFDSVTFEANPELFSYYQDIPTTLIKKAVSDRTGKARFYIDREDGDGSSLNKSKKILLFKENKNVKSIEVNCVDIANFIEKVSMKYDKIILKLDIEGAEYAVLRRLYELDLLGKIDEYYIEWHDDRVKMSDRDREIKAKIMETVKLRDWDALDIAIHTRGPQVAEGRKALIRDIRIDPKKYQKVVL